MPIGQADDEKGQGEDTQLLVDFTFSHATLSSYGEEAKMKLVLEPLTFYRGFLVQLYVTMPSQVSSQTPHVHKVP